MSEIYDATYAVISSRVGSVDIRLALEDATRIGVTTTMNEQARCSICGRFMSHDDILLGVNDGEDCNGHWAHWDCAVKAGAVIR